MSLTLEHFVAHYEGSQVSEKSFTVSVEPYHARPQLSVCIVDAGDVRLLVHPLSES
jgi:hypothetical protein